MTKEVGSPRADPAEPPCLGQPLGEGRVKNAPGRWLLAT